jgi:serine/threonine protein kinase
MTHLEGKSTHVPKVFLYECNQLIESELNHNHSSSGIFSSFNTPMKHALIMEELGPSLDDFFEQNRHLVNDKMGCHIAIKLLKAIKDVHNAGILHRDIKPNNVCLSKNGTDPTIDDLYLIDFGIANWYTVDGNHIDFKVKSGKGITGTSRYCSLATHEK